MALEHAAAWAELIRFEGIRGNVRAEQYVRRLWLIMVDEHDIADLRTFERYDACGLDPRIAVGEHKSSQALADDLRSAGFRGVLSPSAALAGATNLTLFGERYEKRLLFGLEDWPNPNPELRLPCSLVVEGNPPEDLLMETTFKGMEHDGYLRWMKGKGRPPAPGAP